MLEQLKVFSMRFFPHLHLVVVNKKGDTKVVQRTPQQLLDIINDKRVTFTIEGLQHARDNKG